jgi:Holliday junction resolvase RusA-like endonuclease
MIVIEIPMAPVAKGRPRFSSLHGMPRAITPKNTRTAEQFIAEYARARMKAMGKVPFSGALKVDIGFFLRRPKSVKRAMPTTKSDLDNYFKLASDALNGIVWDDDSQIVELIARKAYCEDWDSPSIFIEVHELMTAEENGHKKNTIRGKGAKK